MSRATKNIRKLRATINVEEFVTAADTDHTAGIQAAIDAAQALDPVRGAVVRFGRRRYTTTAPLLITQRGITLEGVGNIASSSTAAGGTQIQADHNDGAVIRVSVSDTRICGMTISASAARTAGSTGTLTAPCVGIHIEGPDLGTGNDATQRVRVEDVTVTGQPSHGIIHLADSASSSYRAVYVLFCGGHGVAFDRGSLTGRTYEGNVGMVTMDDCRITDCGGHSLCIGQPADIDLPAYRIVVRNLEAYRCGSDATLLHEDYGVFARGQNLLFEFCAFGSRPNTGPLGGLAIAGRVLRVRGCRYINMDQPAEVFVYPGEPTRDVLFDGMMISSDVMPFAEAVIVDPTAEQVRVNVLADSRGSVGQYTLPMNTDFEGYWAETADGIRADQRVEFRDFSSSPMITLDDDTVKVLEFSNTNAAGMMALACQAQANSGALVVFRAGSSPYVTSLGVGSDVAVGTGALTDGTGDGTDTKLNISAHTDGKLYIKNRRGGTIQFRVTFLCSVAQQLATYF